MFRSRTALPALLGALLLSACTSVSFKQGAGGNDYKADERACLGTTTERTAFLQCMEAKGWWTRSTEELSQIALVPVEDSDTAEAASTSAAAIPAETAVTAPAAPLGSGAEARAQTVAPAAAAPRDPLSRVRIAMWSKMGAGADDLIADQKRCLDTLGDAHAPDTTAGTVSRGLYDCLRRQGWTGLTLR